jgi:hypothetical protein
MYIACVGVYDNTDATALPKLFMHISIYIFVIYIATYKYIACTMQILLFCAVYAHFLTT